MTQEKELPVNSTGEQKKWYSLRVISGKEKKIQERIALEIERSGWQGIVFSVVVPTEKVYKVRNGKKVMQERNLLPGYILVEALGAKLNGDVAKQIADMPNVIHFLGKETPLPMTQVEANRLLGKVDDSAESGETLSEPFLVNETIKIIDGPFAEFVGDIQEVNDEKKKLKVIVKIFGRGTEVELNFLQVEKIS
jgi:transcription termination/antitermination protein NusG